MERRKKRRDKRLTARMVMNKVGKRLAKLERMNFLECYAVFMSKAQLVEFALKKILFKKYRYGKRRLEKMTLGVAIAELEQRGLRKDFVSLLWRLNKHRKKMAHEFLADHSHMVALDRRFGHLSLKPLRNALWKVEETIQVFDFLNQN